jgi:hypothetical protein
MARYEIRHTWANNSSTDIETRARKDAAEYLLRRMVREHLVAGWAGLDTQWGWNLCRRAAVVASDIVRGVPIGWVETLSSGHPMHGGERIEIRRVA